MIAFTTLIGVLVIAVVASRVAGHLSRNLSRPLRELVGWTERIGHGEQLPTTPPRRGAPEFEVLRRSMREMAGELEIGRARAVENERSAALRESARQVAHELKNPLTPIRFAVERLRREAPPELAETVEVLATESQRLEALARSFAQFGRLPEGPRADVDVGELARYTARATIPPGVNVNVDVADDVPMIQAHHDALARALSNVMLNAVDACKDGGAVGVRVRRTAHAGRDAVEIAVRGHGVRHLAGPTVAHLGSVRHVQARRHGARPRHRAPGRARARRHRERRQPHRRRHRNSIRAPGRRQPKRSGGSACITRTFSYRSRSS